VFPGFPTLTATIREGLDALGIDRFVLTVHDSSFPSAAEEDIGRGSPYGMGGRQLVALAARLGFDGLQLGPQGATTASNPSPYDGAHVTRNPLLIALGTLGEVPEWEPLCRGLLEPMVAGRPTGAAERAEYTHAWHVMNGALLSLHERFRARGRSALSSRFEAFQARSADVLRIDGLYEALSDEHGTDDWKDWSAKIDGLDRDLFFVTDAEEVRRSEARRATLAWTHAAAIERHLFGQFVLDEQHRAFRGVAASNQMALFGDLQIGFSHRDVWSQRRFFRGDYLMGAPPSRTNPRGQPWGYPVVDGPARALALSVARLERLLLDFDGIRIDHPHGLVCPWV
jgi:4-alpha-glucanotransferase